jgi:hypothetical protein
MLQNSEEIHPDMNPPGDSDSLSEDYQSWSAHQKQAFFWHNRILPSRYQQLPPLQKIDVVGLFLTALRTKMERQWDEAPIHWKKAIHAHSSVAKIRFIASSDTPFTGLFKGADFGLIRLSVTGDPTARGFAPGLGIKFFVDNMPSANFSALVSLEGQGDNYNFFANEFSNIVPVVNRLGPRFINLIFRRVTRYPTKLALEALGRVTQMGEVEAKPCSPLQVFLVPNPKVQFPAHPPHDFREDLATIAPETCLFSVYAPDPEGVEVSTIDTSHYRQTARLIGHIETTSEFVASSYGDSRLFFRHHRFRNQ